MSRVFMFLEELQKKHSAALRCKGPAAHAANKCCSIDPKTPTHPKPTEANRGKETHRQCLLLHVSSFLSYRRYYFFYSLFFYSLFQTYTTSQYINICILVFTCTNTNICVCVCALMHSCMWSG